MTNYNELRKVPYFVAREISPGRWRASTDWGYLSGHSEEELRERYEALTRQKKQEDR